MLRDLAVVLACALSGAVVAAACSSPEECTSCCEACGTSGGAGCATTGDCGTTGMPPDAGPACTTTPALRHVCEPGTTQACLSIPQSPPTPTCAAGVQTCNAAGTGFSLCDDVLPQPDSCTLPNTFDCGGDPPGCGDATWAMSIPGTGNEVARSIAIDANGDVVIAASDDGGSISIGATTLPPASPGFFVAELDPTGAPLWGVALENATTAAVAMDDAGNAYVTGTFTTMLVVGDAMLTNLGDGGADVPTYLLKLDHDGNVVWLDAVDAYLRGNEAQPFIEPTAVAVVQGDPVIAGNYSGHVLPDGTIAPSIGQDGFVARYDATTGNLVWATQVGSADDDTLSAIAGDDAGNIVVGGHVDGTAACPTPHLLFAQLAADGSTTFVAVDKAPISVNAIALLDGTIFATGAAARPIAVKGVVVDAPGFVLSAAGPDVAWYVPVAFKGEGITVDANEHVTAVGATPDGGAGIVKLDSVSDRFYQHAFSANPTSGETSAEIGMRAVALAPDHGVVVAGNLRGHADLALGFGGKPLTSGLGDDAFVARFAP